MKFWEAIKALEEGKSVRPDYWQATFKIHNKERLAIEMQWLTYQEIVDLMKANWVIAN